MDHQHFINDYMAHGYCFLWEPALVSLHVASDIITGLSYYAIALALFFFVLKRNDTTFNYLLILFATFVIACGTTHFFAVYTVYVPQYWPEGYVKAFTALVSAVSAIYFIPKIPELLAMPSIASSSEEINTLNISLRINEARLESLLRVARHKFTSTQELLDFALSEAISLTESKIGYLYYYDETKSEFTLNSWSKEVMQACNIRDYQTTCHIDKTGIWGEAVRQRRPIIINDFHTPHPLMKGYPEGHAPLHSFMTVPVFQREAIVAVVGVANKEKEYTDADIRQLTLLMDSVWKMGEQTKSELALSFSEKKYRSMLESVNLLTMMLDTEGNVTFCNDYFLAVTGWSRDEVIGKDAFEIFIPPETRVKSRALFRKKGAAARSMHFEQPILTRTGRQRLVSWNRTPLFNAQGELSGVAAIGMDITEHRRTEEHLRQSLKMESVGRLAGGVAHDFNNMLSVIIGYTEMAVMAMPKENPLQENMREIATAAERASNITRQLLAFSRKELISPRVMNLNKSVADAAKTLIRLVGEDIEISSQLAPDLWPVMIDPSQIDQILVNLAVNARDAMPRGGNIRLETTNTHLDEVYYSSFLESRAGDYVLLSFSDNGIGMPPEIMENIFEPFFTTKGVGEGTGLGLSTVYGIVTQNGGFIHVDSRQGEGTTFRIYLPRTEQGLIQEVPEEPNCPVKEGSETVLVVEDESAVRRMTADMLKLLGYEVLEADGPAEALEVCADSSQKIDLVLTDIVMPQMNGRELFEKILELRPGVKALFMSGYTAEVIAERIVKQDNFRFLQKPFEMSLLASRIKETLSS